MPYVWQKVGGRMTCYECAYFGIEWNEFLKKTIEFCNHPEKYIPPVGFAYKEHDCEFFKNKSGISKWDSYSEKEKEQALRYFRENYQKNPIEGLTCEGAEMSFIEYLKNVDANS